MTKPKLIRLEAWAERQRFDPPLSRYTLRKWARNCLISPPPRKIGRDWRVREDARYVGNYEGRDGSEAA